MRFETGDAQWHRAGYLEGIEDLSVQRHDAWQGIENANAPNDSQEVWCASGF